MRYRQIAQTGYRNTEDKRECPFLDKILKKDLVQRETLLLPYSVNPLIIKLRYRIIYIIQVSANDNPAQGLG